MRSLLAVSIFFACAPAPGGTSSTSSSSSSSSSSGGARWEPRASMRAPRQEMAVVELDGKIYAVGGFDEMGEVVASVDIYEPAANTWSQGTPLPEPLHHVNLAAGDGKLLVLGALSGTGFNAVGTCLAHVPGSGEWTACTAMPMGTERGASAVGVLDDVVFIAGGFRGGSVADVSSYDVGEDAWETLPALPAARDHLVGGAVAGRMVAVGGRRDVLDGRVDIFDPVQRVWTQGAPMPTPRAGCAAAILDGELFVAGGEGNAMDAHGVFDDLESYDVATDAWRIHPAMRTPRHGTGAASWMGMMFVPGGATVMGFGAVATHEVFIP